MVNPVHIAIDNTFVKVDDKPTPAINSALFSPLICPINETVNNTETTEHNCCNDINHERDNNNLISDKIGLVSIDSKEGKDVNDGMDFLNENSSDIVGNVDGTSCVFSFAVLMLPRFVAMFVVGCPMDKSFDVK